MNNERGQFSSRWGFILAAAGSAVGLGNIWGFPTQVATNGGGAFLAMYLVMAFCLAYPLLMAELVIGRYTKANPVKAFCEIASGPLTRKLGSAVGHLGVLTASLILSFYSIVGGWLLAFLVESCFTLFGFNQASDWLTNIGVSRDLLFTLLFLFLTLMIIMQGVKDGIERWTSRLMPALILIIIVLTIYVLTLDGAMDGVRAYLVPDFSRILNVDLIISALGQSFFSLSLGVGTMLVYGSYIRSNENLPSLARSVTLMDVGIAVLAGMLIIPAIYVAQAKGIEIYNAQGQLVAGDGLVFNVMPELFSGMGAIGLAVSIAFFFLMSLAALTSSISMLEVPVSYAVENRNIARPRASVLVTTLIYVCSVIIILNFKMLFGFVVSLTTEYSQPLLGLFLSLFATWIWSRNKILGELRQGFENIETSFFWKVWPWYVKFICPAAILAVFLQQVLR